MKEKKLFLICLLIAVAFGQGSNAQNSAKDGSNRILGLGTGLFSCIVVALGGILLCLVAFWAKVPKAAGGICAATTIVVIAMLIFFIVAPHRPAGSSSTIDSNAIYDYTSIPRIIIGVILLVLLIGSSVLALMNFATPVFVFKE